MRKIEEAMCAAVKEHKNWNCKNTRVECEDNTVRVFLHGNQIYKVVDGVKRFTLAGWNTVTTRSRLNALGVGVHTRNYEPTYKGQIIRIGAWYNV